MKRIVRSLISRELANNLVPGFLSKGTTDAIVGADGLVSDAIKEINNSRGGFITSRYDERTTDLILDELQRRVSATPELKAGKSGFLLTADTVATARVNIKKKYFSDDANYK